MNSITIDISILDDDQLEELRSMLVLWGFINDADKVLDEIERRATREQMIAAFNAAKETDGVRNLHCKAPNEHLTYGIEIIKKYDTAEDFLKTIDNPSPRALEIEVGEDGSIPSDNDTIIYTEAIY